MIQPTRGRHAGRYVRPEVLLPALCAILLTGTGHAALTDARIRAAELLAPAWSGGVISNAAFTPAAAATAARAPFAGTLQLDEAVMGTEPRTLSRPYAQARDPQRFPRVAISFFTLNGDLVPYTQDVIRSGSAHGGRSYWDIIVQPGRVWAEAADHGWSRAAFPFALVNSIEGETHNGLATFLYRRGKVSNLRYQIVQQTAPFDIKERFVASGLVHARVTPAPLGDLARLTRQRAASVADEVRIAGWDQLASQAGEGARDALRDFDGTMPPDDIVLSGLDYRGTFYLKACRSAGGPLPWCDRARFGVWSATKVLANETALLRLAQKYGPDVFELKLADYVPELAGQAAWRRVRFEDAINMATGIGNGSTRRAPNDAVDGYIDAKYPAWYEARSAAQKIAALLRDGAVYPWGPGEVTRYRDQDMFILGIAMDRFLKVKEGPQADIWSLLRNEVYAPIGIHEAPVNRTIEPDGSPGQPLMAYGYYPTLGDMVRIARLYQNEGRKDAQQILYAPRLRQLLAGTNPRGLPTGEVLSAGETTYLNALWVSSYEAAPGCRWYYPRMIGWGGNIVALMPGGITGLRLAKSDEAADGADVETAGMARLADALSPFCR